MSFQLDLNFAGYDQPNRCGVFVDCEVIKMPSKKTGIRAEIRIAFTASGFAWGSSTMIELQGHASMPNACDIPAGRVAPTKAEAVRNACEDVRRYVGRESTAGAKTVLAWVEGLTA